MLLLLVIDGQIIKDAVFISIGLIVWSSRRKTHSTRRVIALV